MTGSQSPERWQRLKAVFSSALELHESERAAYVRQVCGGDDGLAAEVMALLAADGGEPSNPPTTLSSIRVASDARPPLRWLRFEEPIETEHAADDFRRSLPQIRAAILVGAGLYAVFGVLDYWIAPAQHLTMWLIRLVVSASAGALYLWSYSPGFERHWPLGVATVNWLGALGITWMMALIPTPDSYLYYAGLILLTIYYSTFIRLRFPWAFGLSLAVLVLYLAMAQRIGVPPLVMVTHVAMLASANLLALSANFALDRYSRLDFWHRRLIASHTSELESRNQQLSAANVQLVESHEELARSSRRNELLFAALTEALPGTVLENKYRLEEKIGAGGFGTVYRARDLALERSVAVKLLRPTADLTTDASRFRREGIAACRLVHPNAVQVFDFGVSGGVGYLVMELLEGRSLADELDAAGCVSLARCCSIVEPLAAVLSEAHRAMVVHRDLKPSNVYLQRTSGGEIVKIIDFGLAKIVGSGVPDAVAANTRSLAGTPVYMAPERLRGAPGDHSADIYSLGILVGEMLCGRKTWVESPPGPVDLPPVLAAILLAAVSEDPSRRPTADEFGRRFLAAAAPFV